MLDSSAQKKDVMIKEEPKASPVKENLNLIVTHSPPNIKQELIKIEIKKEPVPVAIKEEFAGDEEAKPPAESLL